VSAQTGLQQRLERTWYGGAPVPAWLALLEVVYRTLLGLRRAAYRARLLRPTRVGVPVVVVGNITVGGTGKTPLVVALASELRQRGWHPGIVLRGYGGSTIGPEIVPHVADAGRYGDEAVLLARSGETPVAVARRRVDGALLLVAQAGCDVVISDDGLQHWALSRDIEIVVIDGQRRLGNGRLLPAGPLREPADRLASVDHVVVNGDADEDELAMRVQGTRAIPLLAPGQAAVPLRDFAGKRVHAVAGIGNPERFFTMLEGEGIVVERHALPDHHVFMGDELAFVDDLPVFVTEKDAVKCAAFAHERAYVVPADAVVPEALFDAVHTRLHALRRENA
jgi:tetraacyldisaccharide 4'-kinase